ncbi:MAG: BatA domain-containing protein [Planctomycetes bacterium]|nr:BatA domain-containing protein [Planctomycetota bacterium]
MNMILENPLGLWTLTAIIAVLILHRLRQRPERRQVSSLIIWKRIERLLTIAPIRQKSRLYLILMLQILAVIGLSLALAKPVWRSTQSEPLHLVFLIDNSASMSSGYYESGENTTRWELMRKKIRDVIDKSPQGTKVSFYQSPPLESFINIERYAAFNTIAYLELINISSDLESLVSQAQGIKGELYLCSDKLPPDSIINRFSHKPRLILVGTPSDNRAIIRASATPTSGKEDYYDIFATVKNYSSRSIKKIAVEWNGWGGETMDSRQVDLEADEEKSLSFKNIYLSDKLGLVITLRNPDDMKCDNYASLMPPKKYKVSIVGKDNPALKKALTANPSLLKADYSSVINETREDTLYDICIYDEILPFSLPKRAVVINSASEKAILEGFWEYQGKLARPLVTGIDTASPILKYCDFNVFNNIPYAQKLLPKEKEYIKPIITASSASGDESVLIGEWRKGDSHLVFLNFPLEWRGPANPTDWTLTPSFPIFWTNLINYLHPVSQDYTMGEGLCNEAESDNNGVTILDTALPTPEQIPQIETRRVELGRWPIIGAGLCLLAGWLLAVRTK